MNLHPTCRALYKRPDGVTLSCTYLLDHPSRIHSWWTAQQQDEVDTTKADPTPETVQAVLDAITGGTYDPYLEAVLAVAHNRKRARRGTLGFTTGVTQ